VWFESLPRNLGQQMSDDAVEFHDTHRRFEALQFYHNGLSGSMQDIEPIRRIPKIPEILSPGCPQIQGPKLTSRLRSLKAVT
jgi:hypothetical protein